MRHQSDSKTPSISDIAFEILTDFISGEGQRRYDFAIEADSIEQALEGGKSGDIEVFRELFTSWGSSYARTVFGDVIEGYRARDGGFIKNGSIYDEFTGGQDFDFEAIRGFIDGFDIVDVVGSITGGTESRAVGGNIIITGVNLTTLESYDYGNLRAAGIFPASSIRTPPQGSAFSPIIQTFKITIPNPYLPPTPPSKSNGTP